MAGQPLFGPAKQGDTSTGFSPAIGKADRDPFAAASREIVKDDCNMRSRHIGMTARMLYIHISSIYGLRAAPQEAAKQEAGQDGLKQGVNASARETIGKCEQWQKRQQSQTRGQIRKD